MYKSGFGDKVKFSRPRHVSVIVRGGSGELKNRSYMATENCGENKKLKK